MTQVAGKGAFTESLHFEMFYTNDRQYEVTSLSFTYSSPNS